MKFKSIMVAMLAMAFCAISARAWNVSGVVSCPNGNSAAGISVSVSGVGSTTTSGNGAFLIELPDTAASYTICVDASTLPAGTTVSACQTFSVDANNLFASVNFTLSGSICGTPLPPGPCWLTGGGTIGKTKGQPDYSYGGVVNPGCSPTAAGGGNWNVVDHLQGLHFKGLNISVIGCSGVPDKAPPVDVNIIDFQGTGTITGFGGNTTPQTAVCFVGRAIDNGEPGGGKDQLYLRVYDCTSGAILMLISTDSANPLDVAPVSISTGNLQIHTSSCN
jgi:hypothetical protein